MNPAPLDASPEPQLRVTTLDWCVFVFGVVISIVEITVPFLLVDKPFKKYILPPTLVYFFLSGWLTYGQRYFELVGCNRKLRRVEGRLGETIDERSYLGATDFTLHYSDQETYLCTREIKARKLKIRMMMIWAFNKEMLVVPLSFLLTKRPIESVKALITILCVALLKQLWTFIDYFTRYRATRT